MTNAIEDILDRLRDAKRSGSGRWTARCPAHDDHNPSLSITKNDDGHVLLHCHAGCSTTAILGAMGLSMADLFPDGMKSDATGNADHLERTCQVRSCSSVAGRHVAGRQLDISQTYLNIRSVVVRVVLHCIDDVDQAALVRNGFGHLSEAEPDEVKRSVPLTNPHFEMITADNIRLPHYFAVASQKNRPHVLRPER